MIDNRRCPSAAPGDADPVALDSTERDDIAATVIPRAAHVE
jgi:hypothetical protein